MATEVFTDADRERISAAVREAERSTSGEIVPFVAEQSDDYEESLWLAALSTICVVLVVVAAVAVARGQAPLGALATSIAALGFAGLASLATAFFPTLRMLLAGRATVARRTAQSAVAAFVREEVFNTRERTGILIYLSLRERRVVVLADTGINARVEPTQWDEIVAIVTVAMRAGRAADGILQAVARCGAILAGAGFARAADDSNELRDELRTGRR